MKTRSFAVDLLLLASIFLSTSCAVPTPAALPTPPATQTLSPTATQTTIPTETLAPTEIPAPAEIDIKEMSRISETGELLGVKNITTNIIVSDTLSNVMKGIEADNSYKDSTEAWTEFTAKTYYDLAVKKGGPDGTGLDILDGSTGKERTPTFEEYMQMAKEYQEGTRPGTDIQFTLKINNIATKGYERVFQIFVPFATESFSQPLPENIIGLTEFDIVYFKSGDRSVNNVDVKYVNSGSNYLNDKLYYYSGVYTPDPNSATPLYFIDSICNISTWLSENRFSSNFNTQKIKILSNGKQGVEIFKSVIKII